MLDTTLLSKEEMQNRHQMLKDLPENNSVFKCHRCMVIFDLFTGDLPVFMALCGKEGVICPVCKTDSTEILCKVDAYSLYLKMKGFRCRDSTIISGTDLCPECGSPICPKCGNHQVVSLSRVTGYMSDVGGWNVAKRQELSDRKRYDFGLKKI